MRKTLIIFLLISFILVGCSSDKESIDTINELEEPKHTIEGGTDAKVPLRDPHWLVILLNTNKNINTIRFNAEYLSEEGAEGYLVAYINDEPAVYLDERYSLPGNKEYFGLGSPSGVGGSISFRLDSYTDKISKVKISSIQVGLIDKELAEKIEKAYSLWDPSNPMDLTEEEIQELQSLEPVDPEMVYIEDIFVSAVRGTRGELSEELSFAPTILLES